MTVATPHLSYRWTHWLALAFEKAEGRLPCPVSSQGAHLVHPPPTPALRDAPIDPTFAQTLTDRLNKLVRRQEIRVNMYGAAFAEEWPISRTPMQEAREAKARVQQFHEQQLRLDSDSPSESEEHVPNVRPQLPSRVGEDEEDRVSAQPTAKFVRSSRAYPPLKRKRTASNLPTGSAHRRTRRRLRPRRQT
ncbi:hypothetical protein BGZ61DRAFT_188737 [Ilyonectria robusta]|uniref:uncharacterized protein n=1 Tax=Ilyonectria robusta TaxID=1079257 RepID=UPI001E8D76F7|nr:uncharacterized protein BGZ61DRAFT_188737 [Ilyonectria robusta]KAH8729990.1 hypothetical protein BGZ61DRAFT_188737 [Ilyonectria robusta]